MVALRHSSGAARRRGGPSRCAWLPTCPRRWWRSTAAARMGISRRDPGHGCTGRTARANTRIIGRAYACCASSALTDSVGAGQVTLSISRSRARMFCYGTFTHPLSMAYEGHGHRLLLLVLACVCRETRGTLVGPQWKDLTFATKCAVGSKAGEGRRSRLACRRLLAPQLSRGCGL